MPRKKIEDNGAQDEQEVLSLSEELEKAFQAQEAPEVTDADEAVEAEDEEAEGDGGGEFGEGDGSEDSDTSEEEIREDEGEEDEAALEAPQHWAAEDREAFSNVPRQAQEFLLRRHKAMEGDYTRKMQENSDIRRYKESIERELEPISQDLAMAGADGIAFIRQQVAWANAFKQDPNAALAKLAQVYGVDLSQQHQEDQEDVDPQVAQLRKEVTDLRQNQARYTEAQQQTERDHLQTMINNFAEQKADDGALAHPHFAEVQGTMGQLIQAGLATGLEDAYPMAVNMKGLQQAPTNGQAPAKPNGKEDRKSKVNRAKKAAAGVRSSGVPATKPAEDLSLHDELSTLYDQFAN